MANHPERNTKCTCGSGKQYKRCCMNSSKPRSVSVTLDMGKPVTANAFRMSPVGDIFLLNNDEMLMHERAHVATSYLRVKGPKVLNRVELQNDRLTTNPNSSLLKFDRLFAVDTNTKTVGSERVSVAAILLARLEQKSPLCFLHFSIINCLEFRNVSENPEKIAWKKTIQLIMANPSFNLDITFGLIVDSDLGNIDAYNSRTLPIVGSFYLPSNFQLLYASSDAGREYAANRLISECDREAALLLKAIISELPNKTSLVQVSGEPYTHYRTWNK